jgi:hypothetical protein
MNELVLPEPLAERLEQLYSRMAADYAVVARALRFGCEGCPDNCCDSYFLHHTYAEWVYLWRGLRLLSPERLEKVQARSEQYLKECRSARDRDEQPQVMCPLNEDGLCLLYRHRLLVCRTHGVPARMRRPDGQVLEFPGCFRCQEIVEEREMQQGLKTPMVERTPLLMELVKLEDELLAYRRHVYPKVKLSIAEMILKGPPVLSIPCCEE